MQPITVLSLFDGISCGQLALQRANIPVKAYYASEIDPYVIKITNKNFPNTIQLGDVTKIDFSQFKGKIDLLIGGSPCQSLSIVQAKTRQNLDGKSKLFFNYLDALNTIRPKYFLLENVASMNQESKDTISKLVGVEPVKINSSSFSAQERERLYWTNIPLETSTLKESPLMLKDILEENPDPKYFYNYPLTNINLHKQVCAIMEHSNTQMHKRVFNPNFKCRTLTCVNGGNQHKKVYVDGKARKLTPIEYERLQTLPDDYTSGISETRRYSACGNGWTVDVIAYILKGLI